jgi:hypothetical protein
VRQHLQLRLGFLGPRGGFVTILGLQQPQHLVDRPRCHGELVDRPADAKHPGGHIQRRIGPQAILDQRIRHPGLEPVQHRQRRLAFVEDPVDFGRPVGHRLPGQRLDLLVRFVPEGHAAHRKHFERILASVVILLGTLARAVDQQIGVSQFRVVRIVQAAKDAVRFASGLKHRIGSTHHTAVRRVETGRQIAQRPIVVVPDNHLFLFEQLGEQLVNMIADGHGSWFLGSITNTSRACRARVSRHVLRKVPEMFVIVRDDRDKPPAETGRWTQAGRCFRRFADQARHGLIVLGNHQFVTRRQLVDQVR